MSHPHPELPEAVYDDARDILTRLYDYPYLVHHPVTRRLSEAWGCDSGVALQKLRAAILDAINGMRPERNIPTSDPAWRPYMVLHHRYVLGKESPELEDELGLSMRQIQREQKKAIDAIALVLWEKGCLPTGDGEVLGGALAQEVARAASELQEFDATEQVERALLSVLPLAASCDVQLVRQETKVPIRVYGRSSLFRQLVIAALSLLIRRVPESTLMMSATYQSGTMVLELSATSWSALRAERQPDDVPESLRVLAQAQAVSLQYEAGKQSQVIRICLPAQRAQRRVTIIDDNEDLLTLFSRYLSQTGYEISTIRDSSAALEHVTGTVPDAIVLDVMMRDIDGWELLRRMKDEPCLRGTPVVICSVLHEEELATSLGADAYLHKPVKPTQLLECLSSLLHR